MLLSNITLTTSQRRTSRLKKKKNEQEEEEEEITDKMMMIMMMYCIFTFFSFYPHKVGGFGIWIHPSSMQLVWYN